MELQGEVGQVESYFDPFGDGVMVSARLVHGLCQMYHGSEIILDAPNGSSGSSFWSVGR
jgi:hypothetical protein